MRRIRESLIEDGAEPSTLEALRGFASLPQYWESCEDPESMVRVAGVAGVDPRELVRAGCEISDSMLGCIPKEDETLRMLLGAARQWILYEATTDELHHLIAQGEATADGYAARRKGAEGDARRTLRATAYAAKAVAATGRAALAGAVVSELDYDESYTMEDAWRGASKTCAEEIARAIHCVVEAQVSMTAAKAVSDTGSTLIGKAAAAEARQKARRWVADCLRASIGTELVMTAAAQNLK